MMGQTVILFFPCSNLHPTLKAGEKCIYGWDWGLFPWEIWSGPELFDYIVVWLQPIRGRLRLCNSTGGVKFIVVQVTVPLCRPPSPSSRASSLPFGELGPRAVLQAEVSDGL